MVKTYFIIYEQTKEKVFYYVDFDVIHLFLSFFYGYFQFIFNGVRGAPMRFNTKGVLG